MIDDQPDPKLNKDVDVQSALAAKAQHLRTCRQKITAELDTLEYGLQELKFIERQTGAGEEG